jgi:hypothetical protein
MNQLRFIIGAQPAFVTTMEALRYKELYCISGVGSFFIARNCRRTVKSENKEGSFKEYVDCSGR